MYKKSCLFILNLFFVKYKIGAIEIADNKNRQFISITGFVYCPKNFAFVQDNPHESIAITIKIFSLKPFKGRDYRLHSENWKFSFFYWVLTHSCKSVY